MIVRSVWALSAHTLRVLPSRENGKRLKRLAVECSCRELELRAQQVVTRRFPVEHTYIASRESSRS